MKGKKGSRPGDEGLPYTDASKCLGGPVDGDPQKGLGAEKSVKGKGSITPPKGK